MCMKFSSFWNLVALNSFVETYFHFLNTEMAQVVEIFPCGSEEQIEIEKKWPPFTRQHFQMYFLE